MDIQISSEKNAKGSKWKVLFYASVFVFVPLVIFLTVMSQKYFPQSGLWGEFVIAILFPALMVYFFYRKRNQ